MAILKKWFESSRSSEAVRNLILNQVIRMPFENAFPVIFEWLKTASYNQASIWFEAKYRGLYLLDRSLQVLFGKLQIELNKSLDYMTLGVLREIRGAIQNLSRILINLTSNNEGLGKKYINFRYKTIADAYREGKDVYKEAMCLARLLLVKNFTTHYSNDKIEWDPAIPVNNGCANENIYGFIFARIHDGLTISQENSDRAYSNFIGLPPSLAIPLIKSKLADHSELILPQIIAWLSGECRNCEVLANNARNVYDNLTSINAVAERKFILMIEDNLL